MSFLLIVACSNNDAEKEAEKKEDLSNLNETGMPIVKDTISLNMLVAAGQGTFGDWNDIMIWNQYEEMTNIDVTWNQVPQASIEEKRNLALASGDLPDVFYASGLTVNDLFKYGKQGTFIELNDLIDQYAPNLKKLMNEYPEIRKGLTFPDGKIYSLPSIQDPDFLSIRLGGRPWINKEWLATLGMEMPQTTDEFYKYLKAVKEQDPNGNNKADEIPFGGGDEEVSGLIRWLSGSFGIANKGMANKYIDLDPKESKIRFYPTAEAYKEMLTYVNKLYSEGLIEQNIYSIEQNQFLSKGTEGKYGSYVGFDPDEVFGKAGENYDSVSALLGPNGDKAWVGIGAPSSQGAFVITNKNENPAATVKWMDYFYSDEGAKFQYMGIEGETFEETSDGKYEYLDKITKSSEGLTVDQELRKYLAWVGSLPPGLLKEDYFMGSENSDKSRAAAQKLEPYIIEKVWPKFTYKKEENNKLSALGSDIEKYVDEMQDKFITGQIPFTEWDSYVQTIEDMGLDEYMSIQQSAYERYESN